MKVLRLGPVLLVTLVALGPRPGSAQTPRPGVRLSALEQQILLEPRQGVLYFDLAREHMSLRHPDKAEAALRLGIAHDALPLRLLPLALADLLAGQERWADALDALAPLRTDSLALAQAAKIRVNAGLDAYRSGDRAAARRQWEESLSAEPGLLEAALNLGALLVEERDLATARKVADAALRLHPGEARLEALRAATLSGAQAVGAATEAMRHLRSERPGDAKVGLELAQLLAAAGDRGGAAALYDTLMSGPAPEENTFVSAADLHLDGARADAAAEALTRGLARYPASRDLWMLLGEAEGTRGDWHAAARAYERAVPLSTPREPADLLLADARAQAGDTAGAVQVLRGMTERPSPRDALLEASRRAARLGAPALADTALGILVEQDPADADALEMAARVAEELGDRERALLLARRAAALDPAGPEPFMEILRLGTLPPDTAKLYLRRALWRGMDRLQSEELQAAAAAQAASSPRYLTRARGISERREASSSRVRMLLDTVVFRTDWGEGELAQLRGAYPGSQLLDRYAADLAAARGRTAEALDLYDRLLARSPGDVALHRARASLLVRSGQDDQAKAAWARALELEPESEDAFRALVRLHQADSTLPQLLARVRRIGVRLPDSTALVEREVEILQRMGRIEEAQAVAAKARVGDGA